MMSDIRAPGAARVPAVPVVAGNPCYVHRMPFGPHPVDDQNPAAGHHFRLWAPRAERVVLCLIGADGLRSEHTCLRSDDGWHACDVAAARVGDRYCFRVDGLDVPDPASRFNPQDVHGPSLIVDPTAFRWHPEEATWRGRPWCEAVIYELHVGAFTPEGTYAAAEAKLDELAALGITAVELMPLADFPGARGWGYDGVLPFAPDASYGTPDDLKRFVQAAHGRGLMVLLDVVYNHFGPDGNYLHRYAPGFFTAKHHTPWGEAIAYDGPDAAVVRAFFIHNALYWLREYRFDGLRLDAVQTLFDDSRPHFLAELSDRVRTGLAGRHVHLVLENVDNAASRLAAPATPGCYEAQWNDDFHHAAHVILTGEHDGYYTDYTDGPVHHLARCLLQGFAYQGELSVFHGAARGEPSAALPPTAFVNFLQNHDQVGNRAFGERLVTLVPAHKLRVMVALQLLSPSPPLIFMGEEAGATTPFLYFCDFGGDLAQAVRAGRRREFASFDRFEGGPPLPDPCAEETFTASKLDWIARDGAAAGEWLAFYRALLALRHEVVTPRLPLLQAGRSSSMLFGDDAFEVRWTGDGFSLVLQANLGAAPATVPSVPGVAPFAAVGGDNHCGDQMAACSMRACLVPREGGGQ